MKQFTLYTKPDYEAGQVHDIMCGAIEQWVEKSIRYLIVEIPPRHGKSELGSRRLPAYLFGRNPDEQIISCSYGADLASSMNRDVQRVMDSPEYQQLFPSVSLSGKNVRSITGGWLRNNDIFEIVGSRGLYRSAGIGGGITGRGFTRGLIDDPIKNAEDAQSPNNRDKVWEWYTSTFVTRAEKDACILIIMTRWHEDDLVGRLLQREPDKWTRLRLPAICEHGDSPFEFRSEGEALWPEKYSIENLREIEKTLGSYQFGALYQQNPRPREGNRIKRNWLSSEAHPIVALAPAQAKWARYWDLASSEDPSADRTAGVLMAFGSDKHCYIQDCISGRFSLAERLEVIRAALIRDNLEHPGILTYIERPPGEATAVVDSMIRELAGYAVIGDPPRGTKESRVEPLATYAERGFVHLVRGEWNEEFIEEAISFPFAKHDDRIDAAASCFNKVTVPTYQPSYDIL